MYHTLLTNTCGSNILNDHIFKLGLFYDSCKFKQPGLNILQKKAFYFWLGVTKISDREKYGYMLIKHHWIA